MGSITGDFSYDDTHLTKAGEEFITINGETGRLPGLLSWNFKFLNFATGSTPVTYTLNDVFGFPEYPLLYFENGIPTQFGLFVDPGNNGGVLGGNNGLMFGDPKAFFFTLQNGTNGGDGIVTLEINDSTSVPEDFSMM